MWSKWPAKRLESGPCFREHGLPIFEGGVAKTLVNARTGAVGRGEITSVGTCCDALAIKDLRATHTEMVTGAPVRLVVSMTTSNSVVERLARCFTSLEEIPAAFWAKTCQEEQSYLLDGQIRSWKGACADVSSPICLRQRDGTLRRPVIGQVPAMDADAAMEGLNAAVRAWDDGRGVWPTMSVAARVAAVETFAAETSKVRHEVVNLLMWEVGKSLQDSSQEFDRTLQYVHTLLTRCAGST